MVYTLAQVGAPITASMYNEIAQGARSYAFANAAARAAETTMSDGDYGYQIDTSVLWRYNAAISAWRVWEQTRTSYTPTVSNLTLGNGSMSADYGVAAGRVWVSTRITLGSTSTIGGDLSMSVPYTRDAVVHPVGDAIEGTLHFVDASSGTRLVGEFVGVSGAVAMRATLVTASSNVSIIAASATIPFTWATNDNIWANFQYVSGQ